MALINFPNSPSLGTIYNFEVGTEDEQSFKFMAGFSGTASDGYWKAISGSIFLPATALEIDVGSVVDKYIAPDQLALSKYLTTDGGTLLGLLKGLTPQTAQDLGTKAYIDGTSVKDINGYLTLPGGIKILWGQIDTTKDGNEEQTFHSPFATTCLHVSAQFISGIGDHAYDNLTCRLVDGTVFITDRKNTVDGTVPAMYFAIGY